MNSLRKYWRIVFPVFFIALSWYFSDKVGDISSLQSNTFAKFFGISNSLMRKLAHVILFGAIGYSISSFIKGIYSKIYPNLSTFVYCLVVVVSYAAIDEVHQLTVSGRHSSVGDIFLDTIAGLGGMLLYIVIFCIMRNIILPRFYKTKS